MEIKNQDAVRNYQTITAAGTAKRKNSPITRKVSFENFILVASHAEEYFTYRPSNITLCQLDRQKATAAPISPNSNLNMRIQQIGTWKQRTMNLSEMEELNSESESNEQLVSERHNQIVQG